MATKFDSRQTELRERLDNVGTEAFAELTDVLREIDKSSDRLRVKPESTISQRVVITPASLAKDTGFSSNMSLKNKIVKFDGVVINFETGAIFQADGVTPYLAGTNDFTPFALAADEYIYYAVSVKSGSTNADNSINLEISVTPAASANLVLASAPKANFASGTAPLSQIYVRESGTATGILNLDWANIQQIAGDGSVGGAAEDLSDHIADTAAHGATGAVVGTTNTQTLTNKTIQGASIESPTRLDPKKDTKANLDTYAITAENGELVYATDEKSLYVVTDGFLVAAGGSGSGGINYIENPDAENNTTGYVRYQDAASPTVEDGTGGTPSANLTFTRSTSSPLRGQASFLMDKAAANMQGYGVSYDFEIDPADQASIQRISFDYSSSANYADGDLRVYVYDITNSRLIEVDNRDISANAQGKYVGSFQTSSDSVNYRLIWHVASTNATAWTFKLDNIVVGPQNLVKGSIITDWVAYTPVLVGFGTTTAQEFFWRRNGDTLEVDGVWTNGTVTATTANIPFPTGLVAATTTQTVHNAGSFQNSNGSSDNRMNLLVSSGATGFGVNRGGALTYATGSTFNTGESNKIRGQAKIAGWSSNTVLSEDGGTRLIAGYVGSSAPTGTIDVTPRIVKFPALTIDTTASYNATTGEFVAPESGFYNVHSMVNIGATSTSFVQNDIISLSIAVNGTSVHFGSQTVQASVAMNVFRTAVNGIVYASKGQPITILIAAKTAASSVYSSSGGGSSFSISKVSSPQTLARSETVAASYSTDAGQAVVTGNTIVFEDRLDDTNNAYNTSTGIYTSPSSGLYSLSALTLTNSVVASVGQVYQIRFLKNGTLYRVGTNDVCQNTTSRPYSSSISTEIRLTKGDTLQVTWSVLIPAVNLNSAPQANYLSISRIGN